MASISQRWFPKNATIVPKKKPCLRVVCFHSSGSDSSLYTTVGIARKPMPNPLIDFCKQNNVQLNALHLPGRTSRIRDARCKTLHQAVHEAFHAFVRLVTSNADSDDSSGTLSDASSDPLSDASSDALSDSSSVEVSDFSRGVSISAALRDVPVVLVGHSLGAILAYEFACLARHKGYPRVLHVSVSCMIPPNWPIDQRPWKPQATLSEEEFKVECQAWGINKLVFEPDIWQMYLPILRSDFSLMDTYTFDECNDESKRASARYTAHTTSEYHAPLHVQHSIFFAEKDNRLSQEKHTENWVRLLGDGTYAAEDQHVHVIPDGVHNFPYDAEHRKLWMETLITYIKPHVLKAC